MFTFFCVYHKFTTINQTQTIFSPSLSHTHLFFFFLTNTNTPSTSSIMNSQSVVLATAMVVSSTVLFLAFSKQKPHQSEDSSKQTLRSCLYTEGKKKQKLKKKKRVHFAENVKETTGNGEEYRREQSKKFTTKKVDANTICRNEIPANRIALYNGILRDRVHRVQCSY
ncbi:hypothetical protein Ddye_011466 [Dipteronia dyeriana]|uniref:Transmembrane protein n=1 Tax=Dipteronia dyeriana TaxID=168575 RepID=A0AAE0CH14_9ROSI|nr:hypothetical protein Ddye_011466 [Dipteronia dyeriana]